MESQQKLVRVFVRSDGKSPFIDWLSKLRDQRAEQRIIARLNRLRLGNPGDSRGVGEGVLELRIDYGPGYRVYFAQVGDTLVVLLIGGDKSTQAQDINKAKQYWQEYKKEKHHAEY
jgi:putative addiction module killer protein